MLFGGGGGTAAAAVVQAALDAHILNQSAGVHGTKFDPGLLLGGIGGVNDVYANRGNAGATPTFDLVNGNAQLFTLNANATFTFTNSALTMGNSNEYTMSLRVVQDNTGGRTITWPGSVTWLTGNNIPDQGAAAFSTYVFFTDNAGTTWYGYMLSGQGNPTPPVEAAFAPTVNGNTTIATNLNRARSNLTNQAGFLTSGSLAMTPIWLPKGVTLTGAWFASGNTAFVAGTSPHQWFVLVAGDGSTILRKTADDTNTAWAANSPKSLAFTSTYIPPSEGLYYLGICVAQTGGTLPTILANSAYNNNQGKVSGNFTPGLSGTANTGLTDPASLVTLTARASWTDFSTPSIPWAGVY